VRNESPSKAAMADYEDFMQTWQERLSRMEASQSPDKDDPVQTETLGNLVSRMQDLEQSQKSGKAEMQKLVEALGNAERDSATRLETAGYLGWKDFSTKLERLEQQQRETQRAVQTLNNADHGHATLREMIGTSASRMDRLEQQLNDTQGIKLLCAPLIDEKVAAVEMRLSKLHEELDEHRCKEQDDKFQKLTDTIEATSVESRARMDSLEKIVSWKLTRGIWRPLLPRIMSNPPGLVKSCWKAAIAGRASGGTIAALTKLDGIGPATASAVTAPVFEDLPFMSDEALLASGCSLKYDLRTYNELAARLQAKAVSLSQSTETRSGGKSKRKTAWTAERIGRALWACAVSIPPAGNASLALEKDTALPSRKRPSAVIEATKKMGRR